MTPKASSLTFQNSPFARGADKSVGFESHRQRFYDQIYDNKPPTGGSRRVTDRNMVSSFNMQDDNDEYQIDRFKAPKKSQLKLKYNKMHYKRLRPNPKNKYFYATYIQKCWDARKKKECGAKFISYKFISSEYSRHKLRAKAVFVGFKTRKILKSQKISAQKEQVKEVIAFYGGSNANERSKSHIVKQTSALVLVVNALLQDKLWWKKSSEGNEDKIKRVQAARERSQRLKFGAGGAGAPTVNSPGSNAYAAYEERPVGGGGPPPAPSAFTGYQENDQPTMLMSFPNNAPKANKYKSNTTYNKKRMKINTTNSTSMTFDDDKQGSTKSSKTTFLKKNQHKYNPKDAII